jgi:hypothetical protein
MNFHKALLLTLLGICLSGFLGCGGPEPVKPLSEEEKAKIEADMKKAMQKNRNAVEQKDSKKKT